MGRMTRDEFEKALKQTYELPFDKTRLLDHLYSEDKDGIAECRVIMKKIKAKIEGILTAWDNADEAGQMQIVGSITQDPLLYSATESEINAEKTRMTVTGLL